MPCWSPLSKCKSQFGWDDSDDDDDEAVAEDEVSADDAVDYEELIDGFDQEETIECTKYPCHVFAIWLQN